MRSGCPARWTCGCARRCYRSSSAPVLRRKRTSAGRPAPNYPVRSAPGRVAAAQAECAVERWGVVRHREGRPEQPGHTLLGAERLEERLDRRDVRRGGLVGLPGGTGQVPAVDHELVQRDRRDLGGGQLDPARGRRPLPRARFAPGGDQGVQPRRQELAPAGVEVLRRRHRCFGGLLPRRGAQPFGQAHDVVEQRGDGGVGARGRGAECGVGNAGKERREPAGGEFEVGNGHEVLTGRRPRNSSLPPVSHRAPAAVRGRRSAPAAPARSAPPAARRA